MQSKKQLILWILNVLNTESDEKKQITQTEIARIISDMYLCDRKTVGRNIKFLQQMGYPIKKTSKGFYIESKAFSVDEVDFIKRAIMLAEGKSDSEKTELAQKVAEVLAKTYQR